jgi:protein-S-isoprenylcysteine O-methyltransferase Ste14
MSSYLSLPRSIELPAALRRGTKTYDLVMGVPLILFYGVGCVGKLLSLHATLSALTLEHFSVGKIIALLSDISLLGVEFLFVVGVTLRPPPVARAAGLKPRLAAIAGTYLAVILLLFTDRSAPDWLMGISTGAILCGGVFSLYAIFYLGRSISLMAEARKLVTGGPYRIVRHPLYLGEGLAVAGVILQHISPLAVIAFAVQMGLQLYRMSCEEKVLSAAFPEYDEFARRTYRILPWIY